MEAMMMNSGDIESETIPLYETMHSMIHRSEQTDRSQIIAMEAVDKEDF